MHLCDKEVYYSFNYEIIAYFLRNFPELLGNPGDPQKWTKDMGMMLLIGGAKYIDLNHPRFQQVWWNARKEKDLYDSVLLIRIARHSPGAFNRNSRFLRKLLYQARMKNVRSHSAFYYATEHKWHTNLCSAQFTALVKVAPELKKTTFEKYIE